MSDADWRKLTTPILLDDGWSIDCEYRIVAGRIELRVSGLLYSIKDLVKDEVEREALLSRLIRGFFEKRLSPK